MHEQEMGRYLLCSEDSISSPSPLGAIGSGGMAGASCSGEASISRSKIQKEQLLAAFFPIDLPNKFLFSLFPLSLPHGGVWAGCGDADEPTRRTFIGSAAGPMAMIEVV